MLTAVFVNSASRTYLVQPHVFGESAANASALNVTTDFAIDAPHIVSEERHIDVALHDMIVAGVRALFVLREGAVTGLITAHDILGEKPVKFLQDPFCAGNPCTRRDIVVGDIMSRLPWLETLELKWIQEASVGDIASVFRSNSLTHMVVMEPGNQGGVRRIRGLISRTRVERYLGASTPMYLG